MNVEAITSVEDGVGSTLGETGLFFHVFMSEAVEGNKVCGCDVMDCKEESD